MRCWASPVPSSPLPYGTWSREDTEDFDVILEPDFKHPTLASPSQVGHAEKFRRNFREVNLPEKTSAGVKFGGPTAGYYSEQLFRSPGCLPEPRSRSERNRIQRESIDTALRELPQGLRVSDKIGKVPRRLLSLRGPDGQNLRRQMLKGAVVVWFSAGYEGKRFAFELAHKLGVRSVLIESPDSWSRKLVDEGLLEKFIPIDMAQSSEAVYRQAVQAITDLQDDPRIGRPDGIVTLVELSIEMTARLAEALGLPGPLPESIGLARNKHATRKALKLAGLPTPANHLITSTADLPSAAKHVGFPAVLKPISGAGSLGVKKVESESELGSTYEELVNELRSLVVSSGALVKGTGQADGVAAAEVIDVTFFLERYLDGDEVDVDIVMSEGEWQYAAVSDNGPTLEPYFNETWAVSPSLLSKAQQVALKELAIGSVKALGFQDGIFHVECKCTSEGPHLIEVNARMGGGPVFTTNKLCWNVDLVEEALFISVGLPSRPDVPREPLTCIANSDINALRSGVLLDCEFLNPLRNREDVFSFSPHVTAGEEVVGPKDGLPTWLVEVVVKRPTPRKALDYLLQLESEVQQRVHLGPRTSNT